MLSSTINWSCNGCSEKGHIIGLGEPIWGVHFDETVHFKPRVDAIICSSCDSVTLGLLPELDVESFPPLPAKYPTIKFFVSHAQAEADEKDRLAKRSDEEKRIDELEEMIQSLSRNVVSRLRNRSQIQAVQEDLNQMRYIKREKQNKARLAEVQEWEAERKIWLEAGNEYYEDLRLLDNSPRCLKCEGRNTSVLNAARHECGGEVIVQRHIGFDKMEPGGGLYPYGTVLINNRLEVVKRSLSPFR